MATTSIEWTDTTWNPVRGCLKTIGPMSDQTAAKALGRQTSSINSTRHGLGDRVVDSGKFEDTVWGTKRTKWQAVTK